MTRQGNVLTKFEAPREKKNSRKMREDNQDQFGMFTWNLSV